MRLDALLSKESPVLFVWIALHTHQTKPFNIFKQKYVSATAISSQFDDDLVEETNAFSVAKIQGFADESWVLEESEGKFGFLFEADYITINNYALHDLTFQEICAIHFPEGRNLAEVWEQFYAESLVALEYGHKYGKQFFNIGANFDPANGVDFRVPPTWQVLTNNTNVIFKVVPDTKGTDLICWELDAPKHEVTVHLIQVKVGKAKYSIALKDVQTFLTTNILDIFMKIVPPTNQQWNFKSVKHFVTSKKIPASVHVEFNKQEVVLHTYLSPSEWGPRVEKYCKETGKQLFV